MSASDQVSTGFFFAPMIPLKDGYRGSLIWSVTLTSAGSAAVIVSLLSSPSRRMVTPEESRVSSAAYVTWASPRRSDTMAGTTPMLPSVDAIPVSTRSGASFSSALAITSDVATASEPWIASSLTCTPASAPICSAFLTASRAASGPTVRTVTWTSSPASASFTASSTAYSSSSDSRPSTASRSVVVSSENARSPCASGTCLTQTTIFMLSLSAGVPRWPHGPRQDAESLRRGHVTRQ